jgi:hypothetical protein
LIAGVGVQFAGERRNRADLKQLTACHLRFSLPQQGGVA